MYYSIITSEYCDSSGEQKVYGIEFNDDIKHMVVSDITTDYERLKNLVDLCNELELDVLQINEVIEDFLSE